jgi:4-amino-4-deoxy-L-arabinose transferase-like glycosyltransferase
MWYPSYRTQFGLRAAILTRWPLLLVLLLALILRLLSAKFLMGSIDSEGAVYARLAENLLNGNGFVGIEAPGEELVFPPLFPLLIAAVSLLTHQSELAGRLISVTMGTFLVLPVYFIAFHLYNRKVAYVAAVLTACHPLLIGFASTVFSETIYITMVLSGAYWSLRCLSLQTARAFVLAGVFFGLAYLIRPEAALYPLLTIPLLVVITAATNRQQIRYVTLHCSLLLATFLILATPYAAWLSAETGQFRWEGKSPINLALSMAKIEMLNYDQVALGINQDLEEVGVYNRPNLDVIKSSKIPLQKVIHIAIANGLHNLPMLVIGISSDAFGSALLVGLVVLGLFGRSWDRELMISQFYLLFVVLGVPCLGLLTIFRVDNRFLLLLLPVMIIWASRGIVQASGWTGATIRVAGSRSAMSRKAGMAVGLGAMLLLISLYGVRQVWELTAFDYKSRPVKQAGKWLDALMPGPKTVMDASTVLAFHARASFVCFPYSDSSLALSYIEKKGVDFIVLREEWLPPVPYMKDWLDKGIPDRRAQLIYSYEMSGRGRILIYRWNGQKQAKGDVASARPPDQIVEPLESPRSAAAIGFVAFKAFNALYRQARSGPTSSSSAVVTVTAGFSVAPRRNNSRNRWL